MEKSTMTYKNGTKEWRLWNGKLHRIGGPALEYEDGTKEWYLNGLRHRTDGPALVRPFDPPSWFLNGENLGRGADGFWALWKTLKTPEQRDALLLNSEEFRDEATNMNSV